MGEIFFIRHGQASYGSADYDRLSPLGHQQSRWLGAHLAASAGPFDRVVSGTLRRHRETLSGILETVAHDAPIEDARLNEMAFFAMERRLNSHLNNGREYSTPTNPKDTNPKDIEDHFTRVLMAWKNHEIPDVEESFDAFQARILAALSDYAEAGKRVMIVSSGGPVGVVINAVLGLELPAMAEIILSTHNSSVTRLRVLDQGLRLGQYNSVAHLDRPDRQHALTYL